MTCIVVEGIDNSGKSTLVTDLASRLGIPNIQRGEGPPREGEDINDRIRKYNAFEGPWIFDRHPVVSNPIYNRINPKSQTVDQQLSDDFYESKPIFVYCDPLNRGLEDHQKRTGEGHIDSVEFLDGLKTKYETMLREYRLWGCAKADFMYRIGDDVQELSKYIWTALRYREQYVWLKRASND